MKKLLSLLSVLTISGNIIPTVIAASLYQKQEQVESINKRQKRSNNEDKINPIKIVIKANYRVDSSGVVLNNRLLAILTKIKKIKLNFKISIFKNFNCFLSINNNVSQEVYCNYKYIFINYFSSIICIIASHKHLFFLILLIHFLFF